MNTLNVAGRLASDPKMLGSNVSACALRVAINDGYYNPQKKEWVENTVFVDFYQFGQGGERTFQKATKGDFVVIEGKLATRQQDGNMYLKASRVNVVPATKKEEQPKQETPQEEIPF